MTSNCEEKVKRAVIEELKHWARVAGDGWSDEAQNIMSPIDREWLKEELLCRIKELEK